jgi:hypothetical protein
MQQALLAGLFGMLASPSHTLAGAIGGGGLAAMGQYNNAQAATRAQQQVANQTASTQGENAYRSGTLSLEQQKNNVAMMMQLRQLNAGRIAAGLAPITLNDFVGSMSSPATGGAAAGAPPPSAGTPPPPVPARIASSASPMSTPAAPSAAAAPGSTVAPASPAKAPDFWEGVDPTENPAVLRARAAAMQAAGDAPSAVALLGRAGDIEKSGQVMKDGVMTTIPGFNEAQANSTAATTGTQKIVDANAAEKVKAFDAGQNALKTVGQAQQMSSLMFDQNGNPVLNSGVAGPAISKMAGLMKQAGFSDDAVNAVTHTDPANAESLEKLKTVLGTEEGKSEIGGQLRQQEFNRFLQSTPGDTLLPSAFKFIIDKVIIPRAQQDAGTWEAVKDLDPRKDDIMGTVYNYQKSNPFYTPAPPAATGQPAQGQITPDMARAEIARRKALQQPQQVGGQ